MSDHRVNLLLVDDRPENLLALEAILEPLGQNLIRVESGEEALRKILLDDFAVILLDVQMPSMNGFEVARIIKSREKSRYIPIIFLSAISKEDEYVFEGYSVGAVDYVFKPFNAEVLKSKVNVFVDLALKQREIQRQTEQIRESEKRAIEAEHKSQFLEAEAESARMLFKLNEELQRRQTALEQAMGARNRFYASMSHELRTPINAVIGYSTLMLDNIYGPLNAKQTQGLQRTLQAARHLLELVNDVLDLSKIEAGKIELAIQPVSFPGVIEDLFVTVTPLADEYHSALSLRAGEQRTIVSDPRRVRQILLNLLSNAIKFGNGQPIEVVCKPADDGGIVVEVIDHGVGIAKEDQTRIFEEFVQVSESKQPGTGLGLPISKRLAKMLDGDLTVKSAIGEGSTFCLSLPASLEDAVPEVAALSAATAA